MQTENELWRLKEDIERKVLQSEEEGYVFLDVGSELKQAERFLQEYRGTKGWEGGYEGRTKNYDIGFNIDRESLLLEAKQSLLRAKGALISLRLPNWARELRYYYVGGQATESVEAFDDLRGVVFMSGSDWALKGFPESQDGLWYRCNCRPTPEGIAMIEKFHEEGKRVGTYMSGGMMAITYALLPDSEDDWTDEFMRQYAGHYWHGSRERFWGARGSSSEWNDSIPPNMDFSRWMMDQLEFARRIGFDYVHLDEAFGKYCDASYLSERNPNFVVCPNNLARMYVDEDWRFGWTSMGESIGSPRNWDEFHRNMRERSMRACNIPWWGWHGYESFEKEYLNLSFVTTLADKGTDVSHSHPSDDYIRFSRRFSDYLYGPYVDVYVPQDIVTPDSPPRSLRTILNRRALSEGRQQLILHVLNIDPNVPSLENQRIEVDTSGFGIKWPPAITFASPELGVRQLRTETADRKIRFEVPKIITWVLVLIGEEIFPQVELSLRLRGKTPPTDPLDNGFVPGQLIEVEARVSRIVPVEYDLQLHLPEGWKIIKKKSERIDENTDLFWFGILPMFARKDRAYAITPLVRVHGTAAPSFPLLLQARDRLCMRLIPPMVESPCVVSKHELEVRNHGESGSFALSLELPQGWVSDKTSFNLDLKSGEARKIPLELRPCNHHIRLWEHLDVDIPMRWKLDDVSGIDRVKVRVFPTKFYVYAEGIDKKIMHSYPNLYFLKDLEEARSALKEGQYVAIWLAACDPKTHGAIADEFLNLGAGVLWMGEPFHGKNCPVSGEKNHLLSKTIRYLALKDQPEGVLLGPALRKRALYEAETGFRVSRVSAKDWGAVCAIWGASPKDQPDTIEGTPAVVISKDPKKRIIYIGSRLETASEDNYHFEDRRHHESHWYQTYLFYSLLNWASGAYVL